MNSQFHVDVMNFAATSEGQSRQASEHGGAIAARLRAETVTAAPTYTVAHFRSVVVRGSDRAATANERPSAAS